MNCRGWCGLPEAAWAGLLVGVQKAASAPWFACSAHFVCGLLCPALPLPTLHCPPSCTTPPPPPPRKLAELRKSERAALVAALTQYALPITGHEGYAKAEVSGALLASNVCSSLPSSCHARLLSSPYPPTRGAPQVTGGGLPLNEVDCSTLESRRLPGVHVCGELLDVFGRIGGFNFYWAFVTGRLAGLSAAEAAAAAPH